MSDFSKPPDLTDPHQLAGECESLSQGMYYQADCVRTGVGAGNANPEYIYRRTAAALKAAADFVRGMGDKLNVVTSLPPVPSPPPPAPKPTAVPPRGKSVLPDAPTG